MNFSEQRRAWAERNWRSPECREAARNWHDVSRRFDYQYMFEWMGRPIIQDPQDICAIQEIIWRIQPDLVIETGIAHGGSLILSASVLAAVGFGEVLQSKQPKRRRVIGVDVDIRAHNRAALEAHALFPMITLIEGSSIDPHIVGKVHSLAASYERIFLILDSCHSRDHVFNELKHYASLVGPGSALLVLDTGIEFAPPETFNVQRPWGPGDSPLTAVNDFLASPHGQRFTKDRSIEERMLITCAPEGLLVRS